jgi:hypothetical protein
MLGTRDMHKEAEPVVIVAISYDSQSLNRRMDTLQGVGHVIIPASSLASELANASRELHPGSKIISVNFPESEPIETADRQVPAGDENAILFAVTALVSGDAESSYERGRR